MTESKQNIIRIEDQNDERIELYRNLNFTPKLHTERNVFVAEGTKTVRKLMLSGLEIQSILLEEKHKAFIDELIIKRNIPQKIDLYLASKLDIDQIVGFKLHERVLAIGKIPEPADLENLGDKICILNGIINSENVGAICRNALAFGSDSIIYDKSTSSPFLRRAVRVSLGSVCYLKVHQSNDLVQSLGLLKSLSYQIVSAEMANNSTDLREFVPKQRICYIFGTESKGIEPDILSMSDAIVQIAINSEAESLNVGASAAVILANDYFCSK